MLSRVHSSVEREFVEAKPRNQNRPERRINQHGGG